MDALSMTALSKCLLPPRAFLIALLALSRREARLF
jgi:hypothetical protein